MYNTCLKLCLPMPPPQHFVPTILWRTGFFTTKISLAMYVCITSMFLCLAHCIFIVRTAARCQLPAASWLLLLLLLLLSSTYYIVHRHILLIICVSTFAHYYLLGVVLLVFLHSLAHWVWRSAVGAQCIKYIHTDIFHWCQFLLVIHRSFFVSCSYK